MGETKEVMPVNKKAKDRLFTKIYESEENLRSLARFLIGEDIGDIEIRNVDPVIFGNKENEKPERFEKYNTELFQYALAANSITYIQRTISNERLKKSQNVNDVAEVIKLLTERGILLKEFAKKEVCDMTVAQFSRDDILKYCAREEGREEGREEERQETIRIMLEKGRTPEEIADFCDFDIEEIRTVENMIKERV